MRTTSLLVSLLLPAALGCSAPSGSDGGVPDSGTEIDGGIDAGRVRPDGGFDAGFGPVAIDDFCAKQALAECLRGVRCGRQSLELALSHCVPFSKLGCEQAAYSRGVKEGRIQYDPAAAGRCFDAYGTGSCEKTPEACAGLFVGRAPPDGGCLIEDDCDTSQGYCDIYDSQCPHHCRGYVGLGQTCDFFRRCQPDAGVCDFVDGGQVCVPPRQLGDDCSNYDSCGTGRYCTNKKCVPFYATAGAACNQQNGFPFCEAEYFCRASQGDAGTCERRAGVGGGCSGYGSCLPSLTCSSALGGGQCQVRNGLGERCSGYLECMDGLYCSPATSRCSALPADGGNCSPNGGSSYSCAAGYSCHIDFFNDVYECVPLLPLGASCSSSSWCLSDECEYGALPDGGYGGRCSESCALTADGGL